MYRIAFLPLNRDYGCRGARLSAHPPVCLHRILRMLSITGRREEFDKFIYPTAPSNPLSLPRLASSIRSQFIHQCHGAKIKIKGKRKKMGRIHQNEGSSLRGTLPLLLLKTRTRTNR